ncbi:CGH_1_collapsed_G0027730.mRNA.1.CDS.1 [Saccharomyces cerevisiae]|nr:CGH_1_collapsed_G0027730.mRNA.1.CDS.1 [Saccharomyces cerevisiae]
MNKIQQINDKELQSGILSPHQSWHNEYKDNAYIYIGILNRELTEGDILTVFSEYGVPVDVILSRDENTGESQGFAYLKYEDQRSTILAVDNLNDLNMIEPQLIISFSRPC